MDKQEIRKQVVILANETLEPEEPITEADLGLQLDDIDNNLLEQLDSIKLLALAVAIEDHFKICIEPEDEAQIQGFDDVINIIHRLVNDDSANEATASEKQDASEGENPEQSNS